MTADGAGGQLGNVIVNSQLRGVVLWGYNMTDGGVGRLGNVDFL